MQIAATYLSWPIQAHQVEDTRPEQEPDEEVFQQRQRWEVGDVRRGGGEVGPGEEVLQKTRRGIYLLGLVF